jgi:receptor protein-tyrosine kinase
MHKTFDVSNNRGLVDILVEDYGLPEVWHEPLPGLKVVPVGYWPPNPAEIVGSQRLAEFFAQVRQEFECVLVDTPAVGVVSDPLTLATEADGVLLVLDAQNTRKGAVRQAVRSLEAVGANVLGTVMNNVKAPKSQSPLRLR